MTGARAADARFMARALALAARGLGRTFPNPPVGAVLVRDGRVIGEGFHHRAGEAHAEIEALREASRKVGNWRVEGTLIVTQEPCPMCAGAAVNARIERLVYGCGNPKAGAVATLYQIPTDPRLNHRMVVRSGVLADECAHLLRAFFEALRAGRSSLP